MRRTSYTFVVASNSRGTIRKIRVPFYALHALLALSVVGGITVVAAVASYTRMILKVANYNALRRDQDNLKRQYQNLQAMVQDSNQRLSSLQSLATEMAVSYGLMRFPPPPFLAIEKVENEQAEFLQSMNQYQFLLRNAKAVSLASQGVRLVPGRGWDDLNYTPSLWPVLGQISGSFGERLDPFSGEGTFHAGVDISSSYGAEVRVTADGVVAAAEVRAGYGRVVVVDHGFGLSTAYGHLSGFNVHAGARVSRGQVIGYVGTSGRATGPHVHYEVRLNGAPVNPWRFLPNHTSAD
jgi:murein DD-endopeptidase MepM/ murein hydrolase activator NlpD